MIRWGLVFLEDALWVLGTSNDAILATVCSMTHRDLAFNMNVTLKK